MFLEFRLFDLLAMNVPAKYFDDSDDSLRYSIHVSYSSLNNLCR